MTSWGSSPTGMRATTWSVDGSTMLRVWSCLERTSSDGLGVVWLWRTLLRQMVAMSETRTMNRTGTLIDELYLGLQGERQDRRYGRRGVCPAGSSREFSRSAADVDHAAAGLEEAGLADVVAGLFLRDHVADIAREIVVRAAAAQDSVEVVVGLREEAGADLAVRCEADAAAG